MRAWWQTEVAYQIYPKSFKDANHDGIGDLKGIIEKLDYLKDLGIKILWLSPIYQSPQKDNGYDVSDYLKIDPIYGTLEDMEKLIHEAKQRDIKIIMDLVLNHTSDQHEWFKKSRNKIEPYTDYYIWKDGINGNPPNNWTSIFYEQAWTYDDVRKQYYLHLFAKEQPDLNYKNERVIEEIKRVMTFWLDKGIKGFRVDAANVIYNTSLNDVQKNKLICI
jgi:glycosidase